MRQKTVRKRTREKELRGLSIVPDAIGEPIMSEALQRHSRRRERREGLRRGKEGKATLV
jgi:hypothetical protein